ncbi:hypothetical protein ABZY44_06020 [Streptomyces sp. NPDC006544]|uniref:hypothetical protein n=1 Tax=Streptomyces sp. NPDC006544 TaxID=3154583 RepID=UPI0033AC7C50
MTAPLTTARPCRPSPAEVERLWPVVVAAMPSYAAHRDAAATAAGRAIPLVLVTRTTGAAGGCGASGVSGVSGPSGTA